MAKITWKTEKRRLGDLIGWQPNPRQIKKDQAKRLKDGVDEFGYSQLLEIEPDNTIIDGHQREKILLMMDDYGPDYEIEVRVSNRKFSVDERKTYIALKHTGATGEYDWDAMHNLFTDPSELLSLGFGVNELLARGYVFDDDSFDFSGLDKELEKMDGYDEIDIVIRIPSMYKDEVIEWLANGEMKTSPGMGKGVLKKCGLL